MRPKNESFDDEIISPNYRYRNDPTRFVTPYLKNAEYGVKIRSGHKIYALRA